jgi:hypothetical protein
VYLHFLSSRVTFCSRFLYPFFSDAVIVIKLKRLVEVYMYHYLMVKTSIGQLADHDINGRKILNGYLRSRFHYGPFWGDCKIP